METSVGVPDFGVFSSRRTLNDCGVRWALYLEGLKSSPFVLCQKNDDISLFVKSSYRMFSHPIQKRSLEEIPHLNIRPSPIQSPCGSVIVAIRYVKITCLGPSSWRLLCNAGTRRLPFFVSFIDFHLLTNSRLHVVFTFTCSPKSLTHLSPLTATLSPLPNFATKIWT